MNKKRSILVLIVMLLVVGGRMLSQTDARRIIDSRANSSRSAGYQPRDITPAPGYAGAGIPAEVISVTDGDTIACMVNGRKEKIRLIGVDTPESRNNAKLKRDLQKDRSHTSREVLAMGKKASNYTKSLVPPGTPVELELDVTERDKYGRLLAYVWITDGGQRRMLNAELLKAGMAQVMTYPPNVRHVDEFTALMRQARSERAGLWAE